MDKRQIRQLILLGLLVISLYGLIRISPLLVKPQYFKSDDFMPYWAAGKLNLAGEDPYDAQNKERIQIAAGGQPSTEYPIAIFLNPPWTLPFVIPFSLVSYPLSRMIWMLISICCLLLCSVSFWRLNSGPSKYWWLAWVTVIVFAPSISLLEDGQIAFLVLLGIAGFFYFTITRKNDWAAGASLVLVAIKPQIIYLFLMAAFFWIIKLQRWKILTSFMCSLIILTILPTIFNPHLITQYLGMLQHSYLPDLATPTLGAYLRFFWFGVDKFWIQFIPPLIGGVWFVFYWWRNQNTWNWLQQLPILLLFSQVTAPYTYTYDQVILIPALVIAVIWLVDDRKKSSTVIYAIVLLGISILDLTLHMRLNDFWFIWMSPALLLWFLGVRRQHLTKEKNLQTVAGIG